MHETTALHVAVSKENATLTYLLLEYGADFQAKDTYGRTPIFCAVEYGRESLEKIAKILVMQRAKQEFRSRSINEEDLMTIYSRKWLEDFRLDCVSELSKMKENILCDNFSMYAIIHRNVDSLTASLRNINIVDAFKLEDIERKYPIYCNMLRMHFDLALERMELLDFASLVLNLIFKSTSETLGYEMFPDVVIQKVLHYFHVRDLRKIRLIVQQDIK